MKVLFISFEFGDRISGGLGRVINGVTEELRKRLTVDVFLLYFDPLRLGFSAKLYRCDREHPGRLIETFPRGRAARDCVELVKREGYDVLHFVSVHSATGSLLDALLRSLPDLRYVYSVHSIVKHELGTRRNPDSFLDFERRMMERASLVHVLNRTTRDYFANAYPDIARHKPVRVIGNGVTPSDFTRTDPAFREKLARRLDPSAFTVACMSRWAHGKGLEHFVAAAEELLASGQNVQFVLAGRKYLSWERHWYAYLGKIQRLSRRLGSRCVVLGWLDSAQRNTLFEMADAFVVPSELEYYPYSVLEPAAAKLPLVCSNLPCIAELLSDREDYLAFETGNGRDLAEKLALLESAPELAARLAAGAERKVRAACAWRPIAEQYEQMYRDTAPSSTTTKPTEPHESLPRKAVG